MERIKTMIIIGLFAMSIFLSSQVLYTTGPLIGEEQATPVVSSFVLSNFVLPESMILHFSKDSHTILSATKEPTLWAAGMTQMKLVLESVGTRQEEMEWELLREKKAEESIDYLFSFPVPTDLLLHTYGIVPDESLQLPDALTGIWISGENGELVLIHEKSAIRLIPNARSSDLSALIRRVREEKYIHYYPGVLLNDKAEFYLPITLGDVLPNVRVQSAVDINDSASLEKIAKGFFEENYPYARRIVESDYTTIFVQGNDTLVISEGGLLEYTNTAVQTNQSSSLFEGLQVAGKFIEDRDQIGDPVYLTGVEVGKDRDGTETYQFNFSYFVNDTPVRLKKEMEESWNLGSPIEVLVKNNEVKTYRRVLRIVQPDFQPLPQDTLGPQDVIDQNFDTIVARYQASLRARGEAEPENYGQAIYQAIEDVKLSYFDCPEQRMNGEMELMAIWEVLIDDYVYYFDVHTGNLADVVEREG
jgi:hypothetical protein